jgi:hypothetical protein
MGLDACTATRAESHNDRRETTPATHPEGPAVAGAGEEKQNGKEGEQ